MIRGVYPLYTLSGPTTKKPLFIYVCLPNLRGGALVFGRTIIKYGYLYRKTMIDLRQIDQFWVFIQSLFKLIKIVPPRNKQFVDIDCPSSDSFNSKPQILLREAAKKSSSLNSRAIKRRERVKGGPLRKKYFFSNSFLHFVAI